MTPSDAAPAALIEAVKLRNRRRRGSRRQWSVMLNDSDPVESLAASVNAAKHQRLADQFRPCWVTSVL